MKEAISSSLIEFLKNQGLVRSMWKGGSAATKREDEFSDLDLVIIGHNPLSIFELIEEHLNNHFGIVCIWKEEGLKKYLQRFYVLKQTETTFYLDIVIDDHLEPQHYSEYFNSARHGVPQIICDKDLILHQAQNFANQIIAPNDLENQLAKFEVLFRTTYKEVLRGKFIDAFHFYLSLVHIYVRLQRYKYSPQKYDFSLRYLKTDLPHEENDFIENLLKINTLQEIKEKSLLIKQRLGL